MKGMYVVSQKDIMEEPKKDDPINRVVVSIDSHDCQRVATKDGVINEGTIFPVRMAGRRNGHPFQVPYRAITPKTAECDNLLVPVALSSTHVVYSSIRVEPTWMILGQSAGVAAALSAKQNVAVQELPYPALREHLLAQKQALDLPVLPDLPPEPGAAMNLDPKTLPGIVLDDSQAELKGAWTRSSEFQTPTSAPATSTTTVAATASPSPPSALSLRRRVATNDLRNGLLCARDARPRNCR